MEARRRPRGPRRTARERDLRGARPRPDALGAALEFTAEAGPGDFIYLPPYEPHQEINASATEKLECVLCRSDGQAVAVNLDLEPAEKPEQVLGVDPTHSGGAVK